MPSCNNKPWDIKLNMPILTGKVALVTGGNTGLGRELVKHLASHGAKVYMASRTESRALKAIEELQRDVKLVEGAAGKENGTGDGKLDIHFLKLDLCDLNGCVRAAREFLEREKRLDILINNAGIMAPPYSLTNDGFEIQFQSNFLGHFAFTLPLLPLIIQTSRLPSSSNTSTSTGARIIQITSYGHNFASKITDTIPSTNNTKTGLAFESKEDVNRDYGSTWKRYGQSKICAIYFAREIERRVTNKERVWSNVVHPGNINTELNRGTVQSYPIMKPFIAMQGLFLISPYKGAVTPLYVATSNDVEENDWRGEFFEPPAKLSKSTDLAHDERLAKEMWDFSVKMVKEVTGEDVEFRGVGEN